MPSLIESSQHYGYATHLPCLISCVLRTQGPVIEVGSGMFSTPILHDICQYGQRELWTIEANPQWRQSLSYLKTPWHHFAEEIPDKEWAVALIDSAPVEARRAQVEVVAGKALFVVLHDTNYDGYNYPFELFKFRRDYKEHSPWTAVVSNFENP